MCGHPLLRPVRWSNWVTSIDESGCTAVVCEPLDAVYVEVGAVVSALVSLGFDVRFSGLAKTWQQLAALRWVPLRCRFTAWCWLRACWRSVLVTWVWCPRQCRRCCREHGGCRWGSWRFVVRVEPVGVVSVLVRLLARSGASQFCQM